MITEDEISGLIDSMNSGGDIPEGVEAWSINKGKMVFDKIYFIGLGVYKTDIFPSVLIMTDQEAIQLKGN